MEGSPLVSVLMPVFNGGPYLQEAIASVLGQTFTDLELLIIDDGSTDGSDTIIASFDDPRIRVVRNERNLGLIASLNKGIALSRGPLIARMDADDRMRPERLERQVAAMRNDPGIAVLASLVEFINADGEAYGHWDTDRGTLTEPRIAAMLPRTNCIAHPSVMIRRSALGALRYDPDQTGAEDWDLWLRMRSRGLRIAKLDEVLLGYRTHTASIMAGSKRQRTLEQRLLRARGRYLAGELVRLRWNTFNARVVHAQMRTLGRAIKLSFFHRLRDAKRLLTYSPVRLLHERRALDAAMAGWRGRHLFLFPYLNTGGAEKVHADITATVEDQYPLVLICGFSTDRGSEARFRKHARVIEVPRLLNHPLTRRWAERLIAQCLSGRPSPVLFSSLTSSFFSLQPRLSKEVRTIWLQHAFLHQPDGNRQHKAWLAHYSRVGHYCFVSRHAMEQFQSFLFARGIARSAMDKLIFLPNAVDRTVAPVDHTGPVGVLFVGRGSAEKRPGLFKRVCAALNASAPGAFRYTAVGLRPEQDGSGIRYTGVLNDPDALSAEYAAHDVLVVTSDREGFPMVIMEAMAHGLAIVSTPVGDVPGRVSPAFAITTTSTHEEIVLQEMTRAILDLAQDRSRLNAMRHAAHGKARNEYGWEAFRARYRALLIAPDPSMRTISS